MPGAWPIFRCHFFHGICDGTAGWDEFMSRYGLKSMLSERPAKDFFSGWVWGNDFFDLNRLGHRKKGGFGKDFAQNAFSLGLGNIVSFYHFF